MESERKSPGAIAPDAGSGERSAFFHYEYLLLLLIFVAGALLRFKGLTFQSLWIDELFSLPRSHPDLSLSEMINRFITSTDPHPPLYFVLLHYCFVIFGYSEYTARAFSALVGALGIVAVFQLGRTLWNRKCGLLASLFLLLNYFHLAFSQEVRSYALLFLLSALSYTYFVKSIKCMRIRDFVAYSLFTVLMIYTHYFGLIVAASQVIFMATYLVFQRPLINRRQLAVRYLLAGLGVVLLYLPWIPVVLRNLERKTFWAEKPKGFQSIQIFDQFLGGEPFLLIMASALCLGVIFFAVSRSGREAPAGEKRDENLELALPILFCWIFFCIFIPYYRSITEVPMLITRYEIVILPAFLVMIAMGTCILRNPVMIILIAASYLLISFVSVFHHHDFYHKVRKEQLREASRFVIETQQEKYGERSFNIYSDGPVFYRIYFDLLESDLDIRALNAGSPIDLPSGDGKKALGFWLISGHRPAPAAVINKIKQEGFEEIESATFHKASASLFFRESSD